MQPDVLECVGGVLLVVDESTKIVQKAIVPPTDEFVPRRQVTLLAARDQQFVVDLPTGTIHAELLSLIQQCSRERTWLGSKNPRKCVIAECEADLRESPMDRLQGLGNAALFARNDESGREMADGSTFGLCVAC